MTGLTVANIFYVDELSMIMMALVGFVALVVTSFALRYHKGDTQYTRFFVRLALLVACVFTMVSADHLLLLLAAWGASNLLLVMLMIHKSSWKAAKESGVLAGKNFLFGFMCVAAAFGLLYAVSGDSSVQAITGTAADSPFSTAALVLLLAGAMTQSAVWPFHRWLISSLNSPTPVSAIMHAGLVNGGGFLLARFAPLYFADSNILLLIFAVGLASAFIGTLWKLMQNDIKRMLACSTMGQMGFMVAQCGLGLFPAAIAHLCWHGLFKAYLFLASGGAAQEKRLDLGYPPAWPAFISALVCGGLGAYCFSLASQKNILAGDTTFVLIAIAFIAASQFALPLLRQKTVNMLPLAMIATAATGALYGISVYLVEMFLAPLNLMQPQALKTLHIGGLILLTLAWLSILFGRHPDRSIKKPAWALRWYVAALNAAQPHPKTVTVHRNDYQYL